MEQSEDIQDQRLHAVGERIVRIEAELNNIEQCIAAVPKKHQAEVRMALQNAVSIGAALQEIQQPAQLFAGPDEQVILGRAIRKHVQNVRAMYSRIQEVEDSVHRTLSSTKHQTL